jgi:hypothetical protein
MAGDTGKYGVGRTVYLGAATAAASSIVLMGIALFERALGVETVATLTFQLASCCALGSVAAFGYGLYTRRRG